MTEITQEQFESPAVLWGDLLRTLNSSKLLIITVLLSTMITAFVSLQFITWQYEANAKLLVKLGRENTEVPATVDKGGVFTTGVRKEEINSEIQLISSRPLIEAMVDLLGHERFMFAPETPVGFVQKVKYQLKMAKRWVTTFIGDTLIKLGLQQSFTDREKIIMGVTKRLSVTREKDSDVISLTLRLPDPDLATVSLNTLLELYLDRRIDLRRNIDIRTFFDDRASENRNRLAELEQEQEELKDKWNISSIDEQRKLLLQRKHELYKKIDSNNNERALLGTQLVVSLDGSGNSTSVNNLPADISADASVDIIKGRITKLSMEKINLRDIYEPDSKPIRKITTEIGMLVNLLVRGLHTETKELETQVAFIDNRLDQLNQGADKLRSLERERKLIEHKYLSFANRREDAMISEEFDIRRVSNISLLSPPVRPIKPVYPRKTLIMALSFIIGSIAGIGLALLRRYLNDTIRSQRDLTSINGLACLGTFDIHAKSGSTSL
ncbi:MAG: GumC family protein [Gammaproteobacteria bacterium]